ncbi:hypothetical protein A3D71_01915 [Candidatus Kaiserbacteria bacterium RIFCSPHIGHO2_02_FULL_55_20]|uniref:Uncharacterized protein n=1 Tax=Candidatus Kaiserbacteria bacterium RIFCSPHIGHO2_02_FULL_55_20 TaxID=1798497 RepID=A0A1F6DVV7_9BACT|nr:MAG: hypothetical protein A3D71_01915 [Candidatus Kaiserbacteria bacterium RIFCSPHIGHO2_02_FULL_55_20]
MARIAIVRFIAERDQKCQKTMPKKIEKMHSMASTTSAKPIIEQVCGRLSTLATAYLCTATPGLHFSAGWCILCGFYDSGSDDKEGTETPRLRQRRIRLRRKEGSYYC